MKTVTIVFETGAPFEVVVNNLDDAMDVALFFFGVFGEEFNCVHIN